MESGKRGKDEALQTECSPHSCSTGPLEEGEKKDVDGGKVLLICSLLLADLVCFLAIYYITYTEPILPVLVSVQ